MDRLVSLVVAMFLAGAATAAPAKWTVMVYMNSAGGPGDDLESEAVADLIEMKRALPLKDINVVVQCKRNGKAYKDHKTWINTLRFRVGDKLDEKRAFAANMADKQTLKSFISWAKGSYPAERYALVIWCHGSGWRRFEVSSAASWNVEPMFSSSEENGRYTRAREAPAGVRETPVKGCSADGDDILMNAEAAEAISEAMGPTKLDVLAFDSCLMQMMETAYAFCNVATMLVASEDLVLGYGFQYDTWLRRLNAQPTSDAGQLADILVSDYRRKYAANPDTTLSTVDLRQTATLATAVSTFADAARAALPAEANLIAKSRKECDAYAPAKCTVTTCTGGGFHHVDVRRFADRVAANTRSATVKAAAIALSGAVHTAVRAERWAGADRDESTNFGSYGLAIYFPQDGNTYDSDEWNDNSYDKPPSNRFLPYPVAFVADHKWSDFLHAYFAAVPEMKP